MPSNACNTLTWKLQLCIKGYSIEFFSSSVFFNSLSSVFYCRIEEEEGKIHIYPLSISKWNIVVSKITQEFDKCFYWKFIVIRSSKEHSTKCNFITFKKTDWRYLKKSIPITVNMTLRAWTRCTNTISTAIHSLWFYQYDLSIAHISSFFFIRVLYEFTGEKKIYI